MTRGFAPGYPMLSLQDRRVEISDRGSAFQAHANCGFGLAIGKRRHGLAAKKQEFSFHRNLSATLQRTRG
jgi:hypothetical protein